VSKKNIKCEINPSCLRYNGNEYILYRYVEYPQNTPAITSTTCGKKIDFYRCSGGYTLVKNSKEKIQCKFNFGNYSYLTSRLIDHHGTDFWRIEDLRFVENGIEERGGNVYCLATCNMMTKIAISSGTKKENGAYDTTKGLGLYWVDRPATCLVNLNTGEITSIKGLHWNHDQKPNKTQKNWFMLKKDNLFYCIYSIEPLVYTSAESPEKISFKESELAQNPLIHNATAPIQINENQYAMLCQKRICTYCASSKKLPFAYKKYFIYFDLEDGKITNVTKTEIKYIPPEWYCSSIVKNGNKIKVFAGVEDIDNTSFNLDPPNRKKALTEKILKEAADKINI
jgi:hypothetical protein